MIENSTKPNQILVIDDNQDWLDSLANLTMQVLNCRGYSNRALVDFIFPIASTLKVIVVNLNIIQNSNSRVDNHGIHLVEKNLSPQFPKLPFVFISFSSSVEITPACFTYTEFIQDIKNNYER